MTAAIEGDDGMADFFLIHSGFINVLWSTDRFIHQFFFGDQFDVKTGVLGESYLGWKIVKSSLVATPGTAWLGNSFYVKVPVKRELLTEPYENPAVSLFGYKASERLGSGVIHRYGTSSAGTPAANTNALDWDFAKITAIGSGAASWSPT